MKDTDRVDPLDMVLWSRSFAMLIGAGVSLVRSLAILEGIFEEPLSSATAQMREEISERESTLSEAMARQPRIFTRLHVQMIRVGEVGGVLDETCAQVADLIESDWKDSQERDAACRGLLIPCGTPESSFADAPTDVRLRLLAVYFRALGTMLTAGVPLTWAPHHALGTAAEVLPPGPERDSLAAVGTQLQGFERGKALPRFYRLPFLPDFADQLMTIGFETGALHQMSERIAQLLEYQRRYHLLKRASGG